jgi:ribonuclease HI
VSRIFTEGTTTNDVPDMRLDHTFATEEYVATDGSCFNNGQDNAIAGAGIFYEDDDERNEAIRLPKTLEQSNQTAEMVAVKEAARNAGDVHLRLESDSRYALNAVTKNRKKWEDQS